MSFLNKLFGQSNPLAALRKAVGQKRWADALAMGDVLDRTVLDSEAERELEQLLDTAGDGLAELNLSEGEGCLRGGDRARAAEHFALAAGQARSDHLIRRIDELREAMTTPVHPKGLSSAPASAAEYAPAPSTCGSDCCDSGKAVSAAPEESEDSNLDAATRLELVLSSYPADMAAACEESSEEFRKAFLLAHEGRDREAAEIFESLPEIERNYLYHFELGALRGRLGELNRACAELETSLSLNPGHTLVLETLISLEIAGGKEIEARNRLEMFLEQGGSPAFCHGGLAASSARLGRLEEALRHGSLAVAAGN